MRSVPVLLLLAIQRFALGADAPPKSLDPRLAIELFAEHPQLRTPTGIDVDARGRVWVIESNTHFRPENYDGHPSDRLLILTDTNGDGRADDVKTFADGFQFAMSVAVRPVWMDAVSLESSVQSPEQQPQARDRVSSGLSTRDTGLQQVFLAERSGIWLLEDTDGDDVCDRRTKLITLETEGNYPHNGLAGFAFDALGWMYFGLGENLGAPYKLVSREMEGNRESSVQSSEQGPTDTKSKSSGLSTLDSKLSGGGEGGNVYRMRPDGTQLTHWATGFWNPHASCVDAFGRLFTVDNDADSRPPCRLLHIIEGGDYGFRFRNGRKGLHPFTSWNGEIPGTLPMVAGTGEAPSGIVAYEHDAFPEEYLGNLLVTSWGDHRIDRFRLKEKGASFESLAEPVITGGENFRPVGIALAPDGSLYVSDWVLKDYNLHGQGRVWRVRAADASTHKSPPNMGNATAFSLEELSKLADSASLSTRRASLLALSKSKRGMNVMSRRLSQLDENPRRSQLEIRIQTDLRTATFHPEITGSGGSESLQEKADRLEWIDRLELSDDPFDMSEVIVGVSRQDFPDTLFRHWYNTPRRTKSGQYLTKVTAALSARRKFPRYVPMIELLLSDANPSLRRVGVQWIAEEQLTDVRPQVEAVLKSEPMTTDLFLATLAALEMLDGKDPKDFDQTPPGQYVLPLLSDPAAPPAVKAQALRLVDPADPGLTLELLQSLLASDDATLRLEAIRSLSASPLSTAATPLTEIANRRLQRGNAEEGDSALDREEREATLGLSAHLAQPVARETLLNLLNAPLSFRKEVIRALRRVAGEDPEVLSHIRASAGNQTGRTEAWAPINEQLAIISGSAVDGGPAFVLPQSKPRPESDAAWSEAVLIPVDATSESIAAGERVFYHPSGPRCYQCHTVNGRGGRIGPDLSRVGTALSREKLLDSILNPSKEVAPQFTTWNCVTTTGVVHAGMIVHENKGETTLGTSDGKLVTIPTIDIETRTPQPVSVMPEKLEDRLTVMELRDLLTFLESLR